MMDAASIIVASAFVIVASCSVVAAAFAVMVGLIVFKAWKNND
ncbi:MAG: hypothetical protein PHP57_13385 [Sideroxydans sp.]|nr:hypothetical protein [Sideroxydans sp.]